MPEQRLTPEQEPKDWEENLITLEQKEANQAELTNGWKLAQYALPGSALAAGILYTQNLIDRTAYVPEDQPNPAKALGISAGAAALIGAGVRVARWAKDRKNSQKSVAGSEPVVREDDMTHANW